MSTSAAWRRSLLVVGVLGMGAVAIRWSSQRETDSANGHDATVRAGEKQGERERAEGGIPPTRTRMPVATLFSYAEPEPADAAALTTALPAPTREVHYVRLNRSVLAGKRSPFWQRADEGRLEIPLPHGGALTVVVDASEQSGPDRFTTFGRVEGRPTSRVVLAYSGGYLNGSIEDPVLGAFALRTATKELTQFYRIDPALVGACAGPRMPNPVPRRAAAETSGLRLASPTDLIAAAVDNPQRPVIHVMMVHTPSVLPTLTGEERKRALDSAFLAAIEKVNAAFTASLISARVRLVHVHETRYDESASASNKVQDDALTALYQTSDGKMDEIHAIRDAVGADIVCLALQRADFSSSGLSFLLGEIDRFDNPDFAFSIVQYGNIAGTNVVAHELGHVLGCAHERGPNAPVPVGREFAGAFPYSYGYRFLGGDGRQYHDIMSYPPGTELSYFSNPNVVAPAPVSTPIGIPAGSIGESDTARTIEQTAFLTASYRLQTQAAVSPGALVNVATRAFVGRDEQVLIGGFVVSGVQSKRLLVRGAGPALRAFGVADALRDPVLRVFGGAERVAENDNWGPEIAGAVTSTAAFPFAAGSADAALVVTLPPGAYTAVLEGAGNETGTGLVEVYDVEAGGADRVVNLATRGYADTAGREMVGGFVVRGNSGETKRILIRVLGPSLARAPFRLTGVLDDPMLQLRNAAGDLLVENDDWSSDAEGGANPENDFKPVVVTRREREIFATGLAPGNRREPGVLVDLPPGGYTVIVKPFERRSSNVLEDQPASPGVGVIEVYEIGR